ncbi:MAG: bifunctional phosphoribosylaminoimidazolecarboxamide formyltransferase/IMP cyclohydrolase [Chloroflexota bacterium]
MTGPARIAVGVSGAGSNLRALVAAERRRGLGGSIVLVFADRACPALDWAAEEGIETALVPGGDDATLAATLEAVETRIVVLAGYMRIVGPAVLAAFPGRILNVHPSLLPAFPGAHAIADALAHGVKVTGCTIHIVDETLDGGPILVQEAVSIVPDDHEASLATRIHTVEHRLLPWAVALLANDAVAIDGRVARVLTDRAEAAIDFPRRALLSLSDKTGVVAFAGRLVVAGFELVSTGGTARTLREAGLPVTDVAAVTGFPEMLDGRVKTLHPRIHAGVLADVTSQAHRRQLVEAGIAPFELVVVNLYPFAAAAERPGVTQPELVEEIDIGGPSLIRAAAKNHRGGVAVVTSPARYDEVLAAIEVPGRVGTGLASALAVEAFRHTAAYDARIATELPRRMTGDSPDVHDGLPDEPGLPGATDPYPATLTVGLEKVETLRYGENPHQPAARYRRPGSTIADGPFATGEPPLQGKALSYNNVLDAAAAAAIGRVLRGPACVIVKHTNPCGAAERPALLEAWQAALAGDPVSAFGGVVALTREVDAIVAAALVSIFLEVVVAPGFDTAARTILATKPNLRLVVDPLLALDSAGPAPDPAGSIRSAGGAVLMTAPDTSADDPAGWTLATHRAPNEAETLDLDLAWRLVRGVTSNAIVLVRDRRLIGIGSGQTSRVDAARGAVDKARAYAGDEALIGAACASDAFYPFPDAVEVCLAAGVTAFAQPGGSLRDEEAIAVVDTAGGTMLLTGTRHFRH